MEITLTIKVVLEVPDSEKADVVGFNNTILGMIENKLYQLYAVRNVVRIKER